MHQSFDELVKIQKLKLHNLVTTMLSYEQKGLATAIVLKFIINKSSCQSSPFATFHFSSIENISGQKWYDLEIRPIAIVTANKNNKELGNEEIPVCSPPG